MWSQEDDVILEAVTYYKDYKLNDKSTASLIPKFLNDPPEFKLAEDDSYCEKYGRIFATSKRLLVFHCSFCRKKYGTLFNFLQHLSAKHLAEEDNEAVDEDETKQEDSNDAEDLWVGHESVFYELESNNNENDNTSRNLVRNTTEVFEKKKNARVIARKHFTKGNINKIKDEPLIKKEVSPSSIKNESTNKITTAHFTPESADPRSTYRTTSDQLTKRKCVSKIRPGPLSKKKSIIRRAERTIESSINSTPSNDRNNSVNGVESTEEESAGKDMDDDVNWKEGEEEQKNRKVIIRRRRRARKPKEHKCDQCDKVFRHRVGLKFHIMSHSDYKAYKCDICGNTIKYKNNIKKHMLRHTNEKNFECDLCYKTFFTRTELKVHRRIHSTERPYVCSICGESFKTTGTLSGHVRRHVDHYDRPHKCDFCGKGFIGAYLLKEHILKHTKERPYSCKYCSIKFGCRKTLLNHTKLHINAKAYKCKFCEKAFNQKAALISHTKSNHRHSLQNIVVIEPDISN